MAPRGKLGGWMGFGDDWTTTWSCDSFLWGEPRKGAGFSAMLGRVSVKRRETAASVSGFGCRRPCRLEAAILREGERETERGGGLGSGWGPAQLTPPMRTHSETHIDTH